MCMEIVANHELSREGKSFELDNFEANCFERDLLGILLRIECIYPTLDTCVIYVGYEGKITYESVYITDEDDVEHPGVNSYVYLSGEWEKEIEKIYQEI